MRGSLNLAVGVEALLVAVRDAKRGEMGPHSILEMPASVNRRQEDLWNV